MNQNPLSLPQTVLRRGDRLKMARLLLCVALAWPGAVRAWCDGGGPTLVETGVQVNISQRGIYKPLPPAKEQEHTTCWAPIIKFEVRGPVTAGGQFSVEATHPDGSPWLHFDLPTGEIRAGHAVTLKTPDEGGLDPFEHKFTTAVGTYGFSVHYKNALEGMNQTLFTGKFRVGKVSESLGIPQMKNMYNFYVDHDWALPIGYVWFHAQDETEHDPNLMAAMWFRGQTDGAGLEAHLYHEGKEVATSQASDSEMEHNTATMEKTDPRWALMAFTFTLVRRATSNDYNGAYFLDKNPGEYEIKVLRNGKMSRDAKFTVGDGGTIVDTGISEASHLGTKRVVVPVKVLGTGDGTYDADAWKTDAFYGNPLTSFTAP